MSTHQEAENKEWCHIDIDKEWCPTHGYPAPCFECGYTGKVEEMGTLEQCLYSNSNRILIAQLLLRQGELKLVHTILEDLFYSFQMILEAYCVEKESS